MTKTASSVVVNWGDRTYILTGFEIEDFRIAIASGTEPRATAAGDFWLKVGDWKRAAGGEPAIPAGAKQARDLFEKRFGEAQ